MQGFNRIKKQIDFEHCLSDGLWLFWCLFGFLFSLTKGPGLGFAKLYYQQRFYWESILNLCESFPWVPKMSTFPFPVYQNVSSIRLDMIYFIAKIDFIFKNWFLVATRGSQPDGYLTFKYSGDVTICVWPESRNTTLRGLEPKSRTFRSLFGIKAKPQLFIGLKYWCSK